MNRLLVCLCWWVAAAAGETALLPLPELLRRLDPAQEWLLMPVEAWRRLHVDAVERPEGAWLADAAVNGRVTAGRVELTATCTALNRADGSRWARLFATLPPGLGIVTVGGAPGLVMAEPPSVLLPPGTQTIALRWTCPATAVALPLAAGQTVYLEGDGRPMADGWVRAGDGWRSAAPLPPVIDLAWSTGSLAEAWGVTQTLDVQVVAGARPLRWALRLAGPAPQRLDLTLPPGMTLVRPLSGVASLDGAVLVRSGDTVAIDGFLAADAPVALPRLAAAAWHEGTVRLAADVPIDATLPPGWRPLGVVGGARCYADAGAGADAPGLAVVRLPPVEGWQVEGDTVCAAGPTRATLRSVLRIGAGATRRFQVPLRLPEGWRITALTLDGAAVPDPEALGREPVLALPAGLAAGATLTCVVEAEATIGSHQPQPPIVVGAERQTHRLRVAAAPTLAVTVAAPTWQLEPDAVAPVRAALHTTGEPGPVSWQVAAQPVAADVESVAWMLPQGEGAWCRYDVRVLVRSGEVSELVLDLPLRRDADLRLTGAGLTLAGDGPYRIVAARPWRGERLLRIEGHLREAGRLPDLAAPGTGGALRRWVVVQAPADLDVQAQGSGQVLDADELPAWTHPLPEAAILAAWRVGDAPAGTWRSTARALAPLPPGFIDDLAVATQVGSGGSRTRLACRLAAAGVAELELGLPADATLEDAACDGVPAQVRIHAGRPHLTLPGRTLVQVVLRYVQPPGERLELPRLGGLPVTTTAWRVAISEELVASPVVGPQMMPLAGDTWRRRFLSGWHAPGISHETLGGVPPAPPVERPADPRALLPPAPARTAASDPLLTLAGQVFTGTCLGAPQAAAFRLHPQAERQRDDALGHALGLLLGLALAWWLPRVAWLAAVAAWPLAGALLAWQTSGGLLLGASEWLPLAVVVGWLAHRLLRRVAPCV